MKPLGSILNGHELNQETENAQLSSAMQGVQTAQNSVDVAQNSYDAAIKKAAETAKAMGEVEKRLKSLQEKGKTLVSCLSGKVPSIPSTNGAH